MVNEFFPLTYLRLSFLALSFFLFGCGSDISKEGRTEDGSIRLISGQQLRYTLHLPEESVNGLCSPNGIKAFLVYENDTVYFKTEIVNDEHIHDPKEPISLSGIKIGGASLRDAYKPVECTVLFDCPSLKDWEEKKLNLIVDINYQYYQLQNEQAAVDPGLKILDGNYMFTDQALLLPEQNKE